MFFFVAFFGFWWNFFLCFQRVTDLEYKKKTLTTLFFAFLYCCFWCFATDDCGKPRVGDCGVEIIIHRGYNAHAMSLCFLFTRGYIHSTTVFFFVHSFRPSIVVVSIAALFIPPLDDYCFGVQCGKTSRMSRMSWKIKEKYVEKLYRVIIIFH